MTTATTAGAREHARAQEATAAGTVRAMPTLPASAWPTPPDGVDPQAMLRAEVVAGGGYTHLRVPRGAHVRFRDLDGEACAHLLVFRGDAPWERLNVADTVKVQWQVYPRPGYLLLSDQGRALATVVDDTSGHHDTLFGTTTRARNDARYGDGSLHGPAPAGRELFTVAAAKHGLTRRDLPPSVSFFRGVVVGEDGCPRSTGAAGAGAAVTVVAEMPLLLLVANTAHPLDPRPEFTCGDLEVLAWRGSPTGPQDERWAATPEGRRAYTNTADLVAGLSDGGTR
ncbi:urea amidolyase associated protein UAAP1 [Cellulomonas bogoriensis]|uniref:Urea carboxylase n=1 Tax=Cellulomonas bogoriensis 69B4 = DSM 16987 TaxID=1386082 RepID=A0A0A0BZN9_9CELL|nr:urea amidolyase associated protein UAAP1 [Cellulomonas bogoriensis]KGM13853.1 urea carboxylase [Cellulomonas bogoriensis 69B4 = DSM 16987]